MKQIIFAIFLITTLSANHINWYGNYDKAHRLALKENKSLMVLLIQNDCERSKKIVQDIFMNQSYIDIINKDYISVIVTLHQKESYPIEMLYTDVYPSLFFLDKYELFIYEPLRGDITKEMMERLK